MKKASFLVALIALLSLAGCSNSNNQNNSTNTSETTSSAQSQQGFKKNTLTNDEGSMTFTKVETTKTTNPSIQGEVKAALFIGKFTNKSKEELSPKDFWANYIRAYSVNKNSDSELMGSGLSINTPYDDLYQAGFDKVHPGKTVEFMIGFQNADLTKEYKIVPYSKSLDKLKPSLTIKAKNIDVSNLNKDNVTSETSTSQESESPTESSSLSSSNSGSTQANSSSGDELPPFDGTLTDFVNKYGVTPVVYKVQHFGMTPMEALKSTPDDLQTSGEIQTEAGY